jgi:hypothetical protein
LNIEKIINNQRDLIFNVEVSFLDSLVEISNDLTKSSSFIDYDLAIIYQEYFRFIYSFIFDFFNTQGLENNDKHFNNLNELLTTQLLRINNIYKEELNRIIGNNNARY